MSCFEFTATLVGTDTLDGVITTGASTDLDQSPVHYVTFQIPENALSIDDIYVEVNDQLGGTFNNLVSSRLSESQWFISLASAPKTVPGATELIVNLRPKDRDALLTGLTLVSGLAERLVTGET
jgi:uncharacterized membrane protein